MHKLPMKYKSSFLCTKVPSYVQKCLTGVPVLEQVLNKQILTLKRSPNEQEKENQKFSPLIPSKGVTGDRGWGQEKSSHPKLRLLSTLYHVSAAPTDIPQKCAESNEWVITQFRRGRTVFILILIMIHLTLKHYALILLLDI